LKRKEVKEKEARDGPFKKFKLAFADLENPHIINLCKFTKNKFD